MNDYADLLSRGVDAKQRQDSKAEQYKLSEERKFTSTQFSNVVAALGQATQAMIKFAESHKTQVANFPTSIATPDSKEVVDAVKHLETVLAPFEPDNSDLLGSLRGIEAAVKAIPKPLALEAVRVSNLNDLKTSLDEVRAAVNGLEMKPKITVPAPVVNVAAPDLSALNKKLDSLKESIDSLPEKFPKTHVDVDPLITYMPVDIDDVPTVQYFGYVSSNGSWYIRKFDTSVSPKTSRFYFGTGVYNFAGRASFTYTVWGY